MLKVRASSKGALEKGIEEARARYIFELVANLRGLPASTRAMPRPTR